MFGHLAKGSQIFKDSDGTGVVDKCLWNFLIFKLGQVVYGNGEI
jgi:hypothetical protein